MRKNSIKNIRINEEVQREISHIIQYEIKDPRIAPMTSVTAVQVATDLKTCKVWISVLGGAQAREKTMEGLRSAEGFIRRELAHTVNLRNTPELTFLDDNSIEYGVHMTKLIDEVMKDQEKKEREREADSEPGSVDEEEGNAES